MLSGEFVTKSIHTKKAHPNKAATRPRQRNNSPQAKKAKSARLSGCRQAKAGKFSSKTLHADPYQDEKSVAASCGFRPRNKRVSLDCRDRPPDCPNRAKKPILIKRQHAQSNKICHPERSVSVDEGSGLEQKLHYLFSWAHRSKTGARLHSTQKTGRDERVRPVFTL